MQILADGRFTLGLGSGENFNEHVVGEGWPSIDQRQDMFVEALEIIAQLHTGELITYEGKHFRVDSAKIWVCPTSAFRSESRSREKSLSKDSLRTVTI